MSWIKSIKPIEVVFVLIILLVSTIVLEIITGVLVQSRFLGNTEVLNIHKKYIDKVNHIRRLPHQDDKLYLRDSYISANENYNDNPSDLLFSTIREYKSNQVNVLIQGDSWAEQIQDEESYRVIKAIADKNDYGIINAGISSYAPSLMRSQLQILRDDFDIKPNHIVAMMDSSDMGDELCRYKDKQYVDQSGNKYVHTYTKDEQNEVYGGLWHFIKSLEIYHANTFNVIKFFRMAINSLDYRIRNKTTHPASERKCGWSKIASPMINGISPKERIYLKNIINEYIIKVFDGNVEGLYIVTHPHRGHVNGEYKLSIREIIEETIIESEFREKTHLIDPKVLSDDLTIFKAEDKASHLTVDYHANAHIPNIFSKIKELSLGN